MTRFCLVLLLILAGAAPASAQSTIFVVRHAERADTGTPAANMMGNDPELSDRGKARAETLATMLKDAGIRTIYTTEFKRTQQTAAPLARALGIQPTVVSAREMTALVEKVKGASGNVLIVGHSNTVGETIAALDVKEPVKVEDSAFDNLFVVVRSGPTATLVRLHYN